MAKTKTPKGLFYINIIYYNTKGEWIGKYLHNHLFRYKNKKPYGYRIPIISDVIAHIKGLRESGGQCGMPGQIDEGFKGYVVIEAIGNMPVLIDFTKD